MEKKKKKLHEKCVNFLKEKVNGLEYLGVCLGEEYYNDGCLTIQ